MSTISDIAPAEARTPSAVALELTGRDYLSWSAVSTYQTCPLRYFFRYVEGLPEETVSSILVFGSCIHSALELHFNELMAGGPALGHDRLLEEFWDTWRCVAEEKVIRFGRSDGMESVHATASRVLAAFRDSELARPAGSILGVEEQLRGELTAGVPELLARVDLIVDAGDELLVRDFKTSRSAWSAAKAEDAAEQLLIYGELARELAPGRPLRLEFAVLTKGKRPSVDLHPVRHDPQRLGRTRLLVERVWRAIEQRHFYPAPSPIACGSCPFRRPCREWAG